MPDEPITLVIERSGDREFAAVVRGPLTGRLVEKGVRPPVYMLRIDRLADAEREFWLSKGCTELIATYRWLRDEGRLPPPNLADPPKDKGGQKGIQGGPDHWWKPKPLPRPEGWDGEMDRATRVPWRTAPSGANE